MGSGYLIGSNSMARKSSAVTSKATVFKDILEILGLKLKSKASSVLKSTTSHKNQFRGSTAVPTASALRLSPIGRCDGVNCELSTNDD